MVPREDEVLCGAGVKHSYLPLGHHQGMARPSPCARTPSLVSGQQEKPKWLRQNGSQELWDQFKIIKIKQAVKLQCWCCWFPSPPPLQTHPKIWAWVGPLSWRRAPVWVVSSVCCRARVWEATVRKRRRRIHSPRAVYAFGSFLRLKKPGVAHPRHLHLHRSCMLSFSHSTIPGNFCFP